MQSFGYVTELNHWIESLTNENFWQQVTDCCNKPRFNTVFPLLNFYASQTGSFQIERCAFGLRYRLSSVWLWFIQQIKSMDQAKKNLRLFIVWWQNYTYPDIIFVLYQWLIQKQNAIHTLFVYNCIKQTDQIIIKSLKVHVSCFRRPICCDVKLHAYPNNNIMQMKQNMFYTNIVAYVQG